MPKELLYITNVRLPTSRAHGLQIMKSCEAFAANGVAVKLIVPRLRPTSVESPFVYYGVDAVFALHRVPVLELVPYENWLGRLAGYIQNASFSFLAVLYAFSRGWLTRGKVLYTRDYTTAFLLTLLGLRPVFELHDYRSHRARSRIDFILRRARKIIVNSEGTLESLRAHYQLDAGKMLVAPNGVDVDFFTTPQSSEEVRRSLALPSQGLIISYVGSLETVGVEKGVSALLRAFALVVSTHPDAFLMIVGGATPLISQYQDEARRIGILEQSIRFVGQVAYRVIPLYLRATDIAVIPLPKSQFGTTTSPIKLFEYMAAGKTILASDLPSLRRYLGPQDAEFFAPSDAEDLAKHLKFLIENTEHAQSLAIHAWQSAREYSWESRAANIIHAIHV